MITLQEILKNMVNFAAYNLGRKNLLFCNFILELLDVALENILSSTVLIYSGPSLPLGIWDWL